MLKAKSFIALALALGTAGLVGCSTAPTSEADKDTLATRAENALERMEKADSRIRKNIDDAYGYAIFPTAGKGGLIAGGSFGRAEVYEEGNFIGYAKMEQATVGAQIGGQEFSQLILFQDKAALERFKRNEWAPAANATAVIIKEGVGATADYKDGVLVFVQPVAGAMAEASIGGQKFTFEPATERSMDD